MSPRAQKCSTLFPAKASRIVPMNRFALPAPWGIGRIFAVALIVAGLPLWSATSRASSAFAGMPPGQVAAAAPADTDACAKETNPDRATRSLQSAAPSQGPRGMPSGPSFLYDRGAAYRQARRDFDQAIQDYDQAIKLSPDFVQAFLQSRRQPLPQKCQDDLRHRRSGPCHRLEGR